MLDDDGCLDPLFTALLVRSFVLLATAGKSERSGEAAPKVLKRLRIDYHCMNDDRFWCRSELLFRGRLILREFWPRAVTSGVA